MFFLFACKIVNKSNEKNIKNYEVVFNKKEWINIQDLIPDAIVHLRYLTTENFLGVKVEGYHANIAYLKVEVAEELKRVADALRKQGYRIVVYDSYRPMRAVQHFVRWDKDLNDHKKKAEYYPHIQKHTIFEKSYIAEDSNHTRGGTLDLTLIPIGQELKPIQKVKRTLNNGSDVLFLDDNTLDMYTSFDYFGEASHPGNNLIPDWAKKNRRILQQAMEVEGFEVSEREWWHFTYVSDALTQRYDFSIKAY